MKDKRPGRRKLSERLVAEGFASTEEEAVGLAMSGRVFVDDSRESRAHLLVSLGASLRVKGINPLRGEEKLRPVLHDSDLDLRGRVALDLGASHGGFSRILLEQGVRRLYAVDVAYGIFDYALRSDPRVILLERRNARQLSVDWFLPEDWNRSWFVVCDLSFISLRPVLAALASVFLEQEVPMDGLLLIKPQFEAPEKTTRGVITNENEIGRIVESLSRDATKLGFEVTATRPAGIPGAQGNQEVFVQIKTP